MSEENENVGQQEELPVEEQKPIEEQTPEAKPEEKSDDLRAAMAELATTVNKIAAPKEEAPKELTEEQKSELWDVYDPKKTRPDFMKKFFRLNPDATPQEEAEAEQLFADMQKGFVKQAITGSKNLFEAEFKKLRDEFKDVSDYVVEQRLEQTRKTFYKQYPTLEEKRYAKIVAAVANQIKDKPFKTEDEYFKALAESAADTIKEFVPEFELGEVKEKKTAGTTARLPRGNVGGSGGVGGSTRQGVKVTANGDIDDLEL